MYVLFLLDSPGIKMWWGQDFPHLSRQGLGPTHPPVFCTLHRNDYSPSACMKQNLKQLRLGELRLHCFFMCLMNDVSSTSHWIHVHIDTMCVFLEFHTAYVMMYVFFETYIAGRSMCVFLETHTACMLIYICIFREQDAGQYHNLKISNKSFEGEAWGTVVSIATCYWLDGSGIESQRRWDFSHLFRSALGPSQPPIRWVLVHLWENYEQIELRECLLLFGTDSSTFQFAVQNIKVKI
jgi:hypothetical protein